MRAIPFFKQLNEHYCGPAILQMILATEGIKRSQHQLAKEAKTPMHPEAGTELKHIISVLRTYGFRVRAGNNKNLATLKKELAAGSIVIVCYTEPVWEWGHYSLMRDIQKDKVLLIDPDISTGKRSFDIAEFKLRWKDKKHTNTIRWGAFVTAAPSRKQNQ